MPEDLSGTVIGPYHLIEKLGEGGMGAVYRAEQAEVERSVAVKVLLPSVREQSPDFSERFKREARWMGQLEHRHILPLFDYGESGTILYLVTPLMRGGSLAQRLRTSGPLSPSVTVRAFAALATALDYAHMKGAVHRDLKPQNILFDHHGEPYLADFGIAQALGSRHTLTGTSATLGTLAYMSPEQARGLALTPSSDIYSFGITVYEALAGQLPFESDTPIGYGLKHVIEPPRPLRELRPDLPARAELVMEKVLAKDPAARYPTTFEFMAALTTTLKECDADTPATPEPPQGRETLTRPHSTDPQPIVMWGEGWVCGFCGSSLAGVPKGGRCVVCGKTQPLGKSGG